VYYRLVPADQVIAFEQEMRAAAVGDWQVVVYGNTLHGFTNQPTVRSSAPHFTTRDQAAVVERNAELP
jgi:dienelactone hydrolase